ncbi:type IV toxin-antitoxin system AbiEi family antitoxin domain-containing protein [Cellulomonas xiejunii]|uniref:type IV toxin-antitoxin system AbiEi family antitoxin domain-containing protein n=1 Tax=Cellulomonas xiejunii TaxID=2968083 RepID=UPI001D0E84A9|nr:type IV toxin-antitoxin system AbiEi family antitoxin domain-containing protein [Cellulomonas xiejunii]MCC2313535.1 type IV toxin-antitoxin system AbiEi family antitoxin domain-containing protein [Cellulomonas xiejunii]
MGVVTLPGLTRLSPSVTALVVRQDGVATTAQLALGGVGPSVVARRVRAGHWQRVFRGVVVLQSGPLAWRQLARAALLAAGPGAALSHRSAGVVHGFVATPGPRVVVSVPAHRAVRPQPGLDVRRRRVMPRSGGRLRSVCREATVLDLVQEAPDEDAAVGVVCDAVRAGALPSRVVAELDARAWQRHRALVVAVLGDPDARVESPLEHRYDRVERTHGLPRSRGQVRQVVDGRWVRADRVFEGRGVRVELDGQLAHPHGRTDRDVWRDNAVLVERAELTLRYRWRHVVSTPCETARQVATALRSRGWHGTVAACGPGCTAT